MLPYLLCPNPVVQLDSFFFCMGFYNGAGLDVSRIGFATHRRVKAYQVPGNSKRRCSCRGGTLAQLKPERTPVQHPAWLPQAHGQLGGALKTTVFTRSEIIRPSHVEHTGPCTHLFYMECETQWTACVLSSVVLPLSCYFSVVFLGSKEISRMNNLCGAIAGVPRKYNRVTGYNLDYFYTRYQI